MLAIHPIHRRLAELQLIAEKRRWSTSELLEVTHCLRVNADLVVKLDSLKELAFQAHAIGDMDWQQDICRQIDELESKFS